MAPIGAVNLDHERLLDKHITLGEECKLKKAFRTEAKIMKETQSKLSKKQLAGLAAQVAERVEKEAGYTDCIVVLTIAASLLTGRQARLVFDAV